jgi:hypothetical protein
MKVIPKMCRAHYIWYLHFYSVDVSLHFNFYMYIDRQERVNNINFLYKEWWFCLWCLHATFNNISVKSWWLHNSVSLITSRLQGKYQIMCSFFQHNCQRVWRTFHKKWCRFWCNAMHTNVFVWLAKKKFQELDYLQITPFNLTIKNYETYNA